METMFPEMWYDKNAVVPVMVDLQLSLPSPAGCDTAVLEKNDVPRSARRDDLSPTIAKTRLCNTRAFRSRSSQDDLSHGLIRLLQ